MKKFRRFDAKVYKKNFYELKGRVFLKYMSGGSIEYKMPDKFHYNKTCERILSFDQRNDIIIQTYMSLEAFEYFTDTLYKEASIGSRFLNRKYNRYTFIDKHGIEGLESIVNNMVTLYRLKQI